MKNKKFRVPTAIVLMSVLTVLSGCSGAKGTENISEATIGASPVESSSDEAVKTDVQSTVENNGRSFVSVDGKIYYRNYGENTLDASAVGANFIYNGSGSTDASDPILVCYDPATGTLNSVGAAPGCGNLYYADNKFYVQSNYNYETDYCYLASVNISDGSLKKIAENEFLEGTDPVSGSVISYSVDDNGHFEYHIWQEDELVKTISDPEGNNGYAFYGASDNVAVFSVYEADKDATSILTYDLANIADADPVIEGVIPADYSVSGSVKQCVINNDKAYLTIGNYEGSGGYFASGALMEITIGTPDSLTVTKEYTVNDTCTDLPTLYKENGEVNFDFTIPTDLSAYTDASSMPLCTFNEDPVYFADGSVYLTVNKCLYNPAEAIGWRDAYTRLYTEYIKVSADNTETVIDSANPGNNSIMCELFVHDNALYYVPLTKDYEDNTSYSRTFYAFKANCDASLIAEFAATENNYTNFTDEADSFGSYETPECTDDSKAVFADCSFDMDGMLTNAEITEIVLE